MSRKSDIRALSGFTFIVLALTLPSMSAESSAAPVRLGSGFVSTIAFNPEGTILAAAHRTDPESEMDNTQVVILWDLQTQHQMEVLDIGNIGVIAFSPDGSLLALGDQGRNNTIRLWDVATQSQVGVIYLPMNYGVLSMAFSPDGEVLASSSFGDKAVRLWNVQTQRLVGTLASHAKDPWAIAFNPNGQLLASGGNRGDEAIRLWDAQTQRQIGAFIGHSDMTLDLAFNSDGTLLASAGGTRDKAVYLWDVQTQNRVGALGGHSAHVGSIAFSPNEKCLASTVYWDDSVHIWDLARQEPVGVLTGHDATDFGHGDNVAFGTDGKWLACGSENGVELWELDRPQRMLTGLMLFVMSEFYVGNMDAELAWDSLVHVQAALAALDAGNPEEVRAALDDLKALIKQGGAQTDPKVAPETAAEILQRANEITILAALSVG
jgi:dipeptidyl aminopeptidase/acylaminoacyl peptidase